MGAFFSGIGNIFGVLFSPIHTVFQYLFFQPVFNILMLIYQGVHSFGFAIILLTLLIRGALFPLTRKQLASSRRMQELAPKLKQIQAQYRGDNQGMVAAQQALYKEHGVSMYGGCLPLLIQMPFLYALYYSFYQVLNTKVDVLKAINDLIYPFLPRLTAVPNLTFFGLSLITPSLWLAVVAGVLTFLQMRMALPVTAPSAGSAPDTTTQTAKTMQYIMPFFTIFIGSRFPAGLALYWTVSTGFSAAQQYFISGWGSLWVGVPGMQHLVPKPRSAPTAIAPAPLPTRRNAVAEAEAPPAAPTGGIFARLRESVRQIQEQAASQATANREAAEARRAAASVEAEQRSDDEGEEEPAQEQSDVSIPRKSTSGARDRRSQRASKSGVTLVRPPSGAGIAPEKRIVEENRGGMETTDDLPEKRIARDAARGNGSNGSASGRSYANGGNGKQSSQNGQGGSRGGQQGSRNRGRGSR